MVDGQTEEVRYGVKESTIETLYKLSKNIAYPTVQYKPDPIEMAQDVISSTIDNAKLMIDILSEIKDG